MTSETPFDTRPSKGFTVQFLTILTVLALMLAYHHAFYPRSKRR